MSQKNSDSVMRGYLLKVWSTEKTRGGLSKCWSLVGTLNIRGHIKMGYTILTTHDALALWNISWATGTGYVQDRGGSKTSEMPTLERKSPLSLWTACTAHLAATLRRRTLQTQQVKAAKRLHRRPKTSLLPSLLGGPWDLETTCNWAYNRTYNLNGLIGVTPMISRVRRPVIHGY